MGPRPLLSTAAAARRTAILAKRPLAGRVKTRLCPPLEPEGAARLSAAMLADALERCLACRAFETALFFAPPVEEPWFRSAFPELDRFLPQRGSDLGARLANAFADGLAEPGVRTMVAIGSDQPLVGAALLVRAHEALEAGADLVLGPDHGGGYYLVGLREPRAELFTEVVMSRARTFADTLERAQGAGLELHLLEEGLDVDTADDLEHLADRLARLARSQADFPRRTAAWLAELRGAPRASR